MQATGKMRKSEKALQKVLQNQEPENTPTDLETLTDEERFLFRRIALSMKPYLLLGRTCKLFIFCHLRAVYLSFFFLLREARYF